MPEVLTCASCQRKLQVPESLMGQDVQCPTCGSVFKALLDSGPPPSRPTATAAPSLPVEPPSPSRALERVSKRYREDDDDFDDYDRPRSRRMRRKRNDYEPHRGPMILTFGILGLCAVFFGPLVVFGPIAWVMGNNDLEAIRTGRMDPDGESATSAGRTCGMVATILAIVGLVLTIALFCLYFFCVMLAFGAAASSKPKRY